MSSAPTIRLTSHNNISLLYIKHPSKNNDNNELNYFYIITSENLDDNVLSKMKNRITNQDTDNWT